MTNNKSMATTRVNLVLKVRDRIAGCAAEDARATLSVGDQQDVDFAVERQAWCVRLTASLEQQQPGLVPVELQWVVGDDERWRREWRQFICVGSGGGEERHEFVVTFH